MNLQYKQGIAEAGSRGSTPRCYGIGTVMN